MRASETSVLHNMLFGMGILLRWSPAGELVGVGELAECVGIGDAVSTAA